VRPHWHTVGQRKASVQSILLPVGLCAANHETARSFVILKLENFVIRTSPLPVSRIFTQILGQQIRCLIDFHYLSASTYRKHTFPTDDCQNLRTIPLARGLVLNAISTYASPRYSQPSVPNAIPIKSTNNPQRKNS
jgi:hypothetical protein